MRGAILVACILTLVLAVGVSLTSAASAERYRVFFEKGTREDVKNAIKANFGDDVIVKELKLVDVMAVFLPPGKVKKVEADEAIIELDRKPPPPQPPPQIVPWGVDRIDADLAWGITGGYGIKVAIMDTGIDVDHQDLAQNIHGGVNTEGKRPPNDQYDDTYGHGTMCAGVAAAIDNEIGVIGVGPESWLYAVKIAGRGRFYFSDLYQGIEWCIENEMQVINMSFGLEDNAGNPLDDSGFYQFICQADAAGMVLVASAGNDGLYIEKDAIPGNDVVDVSVSSHSCHYPASYSQVIAVSATTSADSYASWSNYGSAVELAAPGQSVETTVRGGGYGLFSGTSASCPHVVGTAALLLAIGETDVRGTLRVTAEDLGNPGWDEYFGHGLVDAGNAVAGQLAPPRYTASPRGKLSVTWGKLKGE